MPPHWSLEVRSFLNYHFPNRRIGRYGPIHWATRSPIDFYLWGYLKEKVYGKQPKNLEDLKAFIKEEISITRQTHSDVFENLKKRPSICIGERGGHFEHLL